MFEDTAMANILVGFHNEPPVGHDSAGIGGFQGDIMQFVIFDDESAEAILDKNTLVGSVVYKIVRNDIVSAADMLIIPSMSAMFSSPYERTFTIHWVS